MNQNQSSPLYSLGYVLYLPATIITCFSHHLYLVTNHDFPKEEMGVSPIFVFLSFYIVVTMILQFAFVCHLMKRKRIKGLHYTLITDLVALLPFVGSWGSVENVGNAFRDVGACWFLFTGLLIIWRIIYQIIALLTSQKTESKNIKNGIKAANIVVFLAAGILLIQFGFLAIRDMELFLSENGGILLGKDYI